MSELQFTWLKKGERTPGTTNPLLKISGLTVRVGMRRVLDDIDLEVYEGDHVLVTGPNGCGKSTLFNAIMGVPPAKVGDGAIVFMGKDISGLPTHERVLCGVGYMLQRDNTFPALTVKDNIILALGPEGPEQVAREFPELICSLGMNRPAGRLSGGQKQKLAWVTTVLSGAKLILLDEPRAGIDDKKELIFHRNAPALVEIEH